ncbi:hypothetical protein KC19_1G189800 [Ceratodon purpureus]|uniref:Alpha-galactosidase n=1 Tax=Ceratodon purpureus TaxID=3225 RepID=A0A8T0JA83_CERPU|nr:hypothetical protein KC19_1G189800 [Ceratodon purpureus]
MAIPKLLNGGLLSTRRKSVTRACERGLKLRSQYADGVKMPTTISIVVAFVGLFFSILCKADGGVPTKGFEHLALTPPRGWNSYNSFSWIVSEKEFLDNAKFVSEHLLKFGYEYVVVDFLWYRKLEPDASVWSSGHDVIDQWGRPVPDPGRWPSSRDGRGFARVAEQVHAMGLKFGIHVMRGISTAAVQANTPILGAKGSPDTKSGRPWLAADIAVPGTECKWMTCCFMGIDASSEGGRAFVKSLYDQYASWGVDFIKHDCVFGVPDLRISEIELVSKSIAEAGRPMVYSLSPGVQATPEIGSKVSNMANMYRVTADDWDTWSDLETHFDVARDFAAAGMIGAPSERGRSWPDLDMLPLGWLTDPGPHRWCNLSPAEQHTQVSLWAMAKSPLMYGGDLRAIDNATLSLITNPWILDINAHSVDNLELQSTPSHTSSKSSRFGLSDCKDEIPRRWSLRSVRHSQDANQVCWTSTASSERRWRKGEELPLKCLHWTPFASGSQVANTSSRMGFIASPPELHGCLAPVVLGISNTEVQQPSMQNVECSSEEPNQLWHLTAEGRLRNEHTGLCAIVVEEGERIWVARHSSDQVYYMAFFNLGSTATHMAVGIDTVIRRFVPSTKIIDVSSGSNPHRRVMLADNTDLICKAFDVWNQHDLGVVGNSVGALVEGHGVAVYILTCTTSL